MTRVPPLFVYPALCGVSSAVGQCCHHFACACGGSCGSRDDTVCVGGVRLAKNGHRFMLIGCIACATSVVLSSQIWSVEDGLLHNLPGHSGEVFCVRWSPCGPGSANPGKPLYLATSSTDSAVKLWNPATGMCLRSFRQHTQVVGSVAFSPDASLVASGAHDNFIHIFETETGRLVQSVQPGVMVHSVAWTAQGDRLAAACGDGVVSVVAKPGAPTSSSRTPVSTPHRSTAATSTVPGSAGSIQSGSTGKPAVGTGSKAGGATDAAVEASPALNLANSMAQAATDATPKTEQ